MIPCSLLILGTHNPKKGAELSDLLAPLGITVETLAHYRQSIDVLEDGDSFAANAKKKRLNRPATSDNGFLEKTVAFASTRWRADPASIRLVLPVRTQPI